MPNIAIIAIPLLPLLGFLINGTSALIESRGGTGLAKKIVSFVACLLPLAAFALSLNAFLALKSHPTLAALSAPNVLDWMVLDQFSLSFGFSIDRLTSLMMLVVTGVGFLIHVYSTGYMHEDPAYSRYMSYINLFLFFMSLLVMADSLVLLFVGWEGVGLCSYLLIGFWFSDAEKAAAGKKAFVVNRIGDFAFLVGMFLIASTFAAVKAPVDVDFPAATNYLDFSYIAAHAGLLAPMATAICLCLFIGATGKSAQIPLYVWLPDAMAGPTPVSALIHAATMVTAGIYMVARLSFLFVLSPFAMNVVATVGLATAVLAALIAVTQYDIKKVLAYSTVSQLGFMVMALGVGAFSAAIFHVMTHAFFKACLFLGAGSVIHALHHEQDVRHMGGLLKKMPVTGVTFLVSTLAIAGVPPLSGFFSKDEILYMVYAKAPHPAFYWVALATAGLTAFYMTRVFVYAFLGETRYHHPDDIHESPWVMTLPLVILAILATVAGFIGLPHVFGENRLAEWLDVLGQKTPHHIKGSSLQETHLMAISAGWGMICIAASWFVFARAQRLADTAKKMLGPVYRLMSGKFRVDEFYDAAIVRPVKALSDAVLFKLVDVKLIDGLMVNGLADASRFLTRTLSAIQTGQVAAYLFYLLLGICFVLGFVVLN
jgi:NADH-quinone oxidoreductase subunit L